MEANGEELGLESWERGTPRPDHRYCSANSSPYWAELLSQPETRCCSKEPQNGVYQGTVECLLLPFWTWVSLSVHGGGRLDQMVPGASSLLPSLPQSGRGPQLGLVHPRVWGQADLRCPRQRTALSAEKSEKKNRWDLGSWADLFWMEGNSPLVPSKTAQCSGCRWEPQGKTKIPNPVTSVVTSPRVSLYCPSDKDFSA